MKGIIRDNPTLFDVLVRLTDPVVLVLATWLYGLFETSGLNQLLKIQVIYCSILIILIFPLFGLYRSWRAASVFQELKAVFLAWVVVNLSFNLLLLLLANKEQFEVLWPYGLFQTEMYWYWNSTILGCLFGYRIVLRTLFRYARRKGFNRKRVIIAGAGDLGRRVSKIFESNTWLGYEITGFFDDNHELKGQIVDGIPVVGSLDYAARFVNANHIDIVFIAIPFRHEARVKELVQQLCDTTADTYLIPDVYNFFLLNLGMTEVAGLPALNLNAVPIVGINAIAKWAEDMVVATLILLLISPILLVLSLAVKLTSPGPVIFKQRRYGLRGEEIIVYKFRTMTVCEDGDNVKLADRCDPRITPLGAFMRRTSLDELPQFINVLQGRLSVVGPRPHAWAINEQYRKLVPTYTIRHRVKPGITGWAQVNGWRGNTDTLEKLQKRVEFDLEYIRRWSVLFDLNIIFLTVAKGFIGENAY